MCWLFFYSSLSYSHSLLHFIYRLCVGNFYYPSTFKSSLSFLLFIRYGFYFIFFVFFFCFFFLSKCFPNIKNKHFKNYSKMKLVYILTIQIMIHNRLTQRYPNKRHNQLKTEESVQRGQLQQYRQA